ncbi:sialate:H+ symport family MFS transporter [Streptomyces sp. 8L]|uniref:sialate:H+ symport family MFS transporter n=1 Tax=Streptomyces sp. 8L TaxID=2877242 RepID=UPI001CD3FF3E|nr:sialate:H+ symport family MFS transporter [Streptomyces sp. 8L]MCA1217063.1 sialate:H+ symport family MFS transporter [Streptomyces sp. 8L]
MQSSSTAAPPWYRQVGIRRWKAFFAAWLGYVLDGFDFVLITLVLTEVAQEFRLSTTQSASLVSAAFITRWLGGAVLGAVGDRFGRTWAMIFSILLYTLGTLACGFAWNYTSLFTARLAIGMGMAGEYGASATYVLESWPARLRNKASGFLISGYSVGTVLAAEAYKVVVPALGWRWMFYIGLAPILIALWVRRALPEADEWTEKVAVPGVRANPFQPLFRSARLAALNVALAAVATVSLFCVFTSVAGGATPVLSLLAGLCLAAFAVQLGGRRWLLYLSLMVTIFVAFLYSWPIQALLPTYLKTQLHYSTGEVTDVLFYAGFGTVAGCWLAGFLGDRIGTVKAYALTLVVSLVFIYPVFATRDNLVLLGILLFVLQGLSFGISSLLPRYIGGHFPTQQRAAGLGFTYNVGALGGAVAPVLGARLASGMQLGTALAVLTFAGTLLVVALVGFDVPHRLQRLITPDSVRDHLAADADPAGAEPAGVRATDPTIRTGP